MGCYFSEIANVLKSLPWTRWQGTCSPQGSSAHGYWQLSWSSPPGPSCRRPKLSPHKSPHTGTVRRRLFSPSEAGYFGPPVQSCWMSGMEWQVWEPHPLFMLFFNSISLDFFPFVFSHLPLFQLPLFDPNQVATLQLPSIYPLFIAWVGFHEFLR